MYPTHRELLSIFFVRSIPFHSIVYLQLRGAQILSAARLHKQGYPRCMPLAEFRRRFQLLGSAAPTAGLEDKAAVEEILAALDLEHSSYRVGLSQVRTLIYYIK